ncbi:MAG: polysaccharide deacetylase family protein [Treponema sp.]|nr:polysaccharide deacetylase family protein [Treponema sp.]
MSKYLCLSFDDGPNLGDDTTMNDMLDILEKHNVPASFFLIGNKITEENKKVILRAMDLGCDIQNHSWSHPAMAEMSEEAVAEEYKKCDDLITEVTGKRPEFFRPPFISVSPKMYNIIKTPFICGHGCEDWVPEVSADERLNRLVKETKDGTIYLLHVMEGNKNTLEAVDRLVPMMKEQGYTFVNLPDLFRLEGVNPAVPNSLWSFLK